VIVRPPLAGGGGYTTSLQKKKKKRVLLDKNITINHHLSFGQSTDFLISFLGDEGSSIKSSSSLSETLRVAISHRGASGEGKNGTKAC